MLNPGDATPADGERRPPRRDLHRGVELAAAYSWRLVAIAAAVVGLVWLTGQLLVVVVPIAVAALLTRALSPLSSWLGRRGLKPALAATVTLLGFIVAVCAIVGLVGWAIAGEVQDIGPTISEGIDDVADWLVSDGPFDVTRQDVDGWRERAGESLSGFVSSGDGSVVSGAVLVGEFIVGGLLTLIVTFFLLKDGRRFVDGAIQRAPASRRDVARRAADRAWEAAGGYIRGAALLGIVESIVIGVTLLLVGASLVVPIMVITFLGAFVPIVGASAAGIIAVLVALGTAGPIPALIVAVVVLVVQQLDNDLLAPVIYGKALQLHPLVILLGIAAGGSLFGLVGTVFAVPVLAVTINAVSEIRSHPDPALLEAPA